MTTPQDNTQSLNEILLGYAVDGITIDEDAVLGQYPEKVEAAHAINLEEAKQAILDWVSKEIVEELRGFDRNTSVGGVVNTILQRIDQTLKAHGWKGEHK